MSWLYLHTLTEGSRGSRWRAQLSGMRLGKSNEVPAVKARTHRGSVALFLQSVTTLCSIHVSPSAGVFALFYVSNRFRTFPFSIKDQCIVFYSGVRGAGSFSLAFLLPLSLFPRKKMFVTATLVVIYFTVFIQVGRFYSYLK